MKTTSFLALIILLISYSCSSDPTKITQKSIIERDVFTDILVEMHIMDAISNESEYYRKFAAGDSINLYELIFERHGVTAVQFDSTVSAYTRRSDLYKEIYDEVLLELNVKLDEANADPEEEEENNLTGL